MFSDDKDLRQYLLNDSIVVKLLDSLKRVEFGVPLENTFQSL